MQTPRLLTHRDGLAFVSKPAGMATHRSATDSNDLIGWLTRQGKLLRKVRPVHRLDRDTSGVILCAEPARRAEASGWFERREIEKTYLALVYGRMQPSGTIEAPIDGQEALTVVELVEGFMVDGQPLSLLSLSLIHI